VEGLTPQNPKLLKVGFDPDRQFSALLFLAENWVNQDKFPDANKGFFDFMY
jgi:hypothetical protein